MQDTVEPVVLKHSEQRLALFQSANEAEEVGGLISQSRLNVHNIFTKPAHTTFHVLTCSVNR